MARKPMYKPLPPPSVPPDQARYEHAAGRPYKVSPSPKPAKPKPRKLKGPKWPADHEGLHKKAARKGWVTRRKNAGLGPVERSLSTTRKLSAPRAAAGKPRAAPITIKLRRQRLKPKVDPAEELAKLESQLVYLARDLEHAHVRERAAGMPFEAAEARRDADAIKAQQKKIRARIRRLRAAAK